MSNYNVTLRVMDDDMISKDDPIGEVIVPLWHVDFTTGVEEVKELRAVQKVKKYNPNSYLSENKTCRQLLSHPAKREVTQFLPSHQMKK